MTIIEKLRKDIGKAMAVYTHSPDRQHNIEAINDILAANNALKVKQKLIHYVDNLSSGFVSIWFFLEVNKFKNALKEVLNSPQYQENAILKAMVSEAGISINHDNIMPLSSENSILARMDRLEMTLQQQQQEMGSLQQEIKRLKSENQFLMKTISALHRENTELVAKNSQLADDKSKVEKENRDLKKKYENLSKENAALKQQLMHLTSPQETQKLLPSCKGDVSNVFMKSLVTPREKPKSYQSLSAISLSVK